MVKYDHDITWSYFENILTTPITSVEKWSNLLDQLFPDDIPIKPSLKQLDISVDSKESKTWVDFILKKLPLNNIKTIWINIAPMLYEDKEVYAIFCAASFNEKLPPDEYDIVLNDSYYLLDAMAVIPSIISNSDDSSFLDWILPISYISYALYDIVWKELNNMNITVCCGYDGGDYIELLTNNK